MVRDTCDAEVMARRFPVPVPMEKDATYRQERHYAYWRRLFVVLDAIHYAAVRSIASEPHTVS